MEKGNRQMIKDQITGTEVLRNAMKARKKSSAVVARELGIPADHMANFIAGTRTLAPDTLCTLATYLFNGSAEFVPALDKLRSTNTAPAQTMAAIPSAGQPPSINRPRYPHVARNR
jgi:plasmid maintenance system antidote protein VapI